MYQAICISGEPAFHQIKIILVKTPLQLNANLSRILSRSRCSSVFVRRAAIVRSAESGLVVLYTTSFARYFQYPMQGMRCPCLRSLSTQRTIDHFHCDTNILIIITRYECCFDSDAFAMKDLLTDDNCQQYQIIHRTKQLKITTQPHLKYY